MYGYVSLAVVVLVFAAAVLARRWQTARTSHSAAASPGERYEEARALSEMNRHHQNFGGGF